jgi:hypothetical protein
MGMRVSLGIEIELHKGRYTNLEDSLSQNSFLSSDAYMVGISGQSDLIYLKRDFLFKSGYFRGTTSGSLFTIPGRYRGKTLVVGHSDISTNRSTLRLLQAVGVRKVFGVNTQPLKDFSYSLPLGLTNFTNESKLHSLFGDVSHFRVANSTTNFEDKFRPHFYLNFTKANNSKNRENALRFFSKLPPPYKVTLDSPDFTVNGRVDFLSKCRQSAFVVCPEGNGIDTHRLWETLYMGGIPVVLKHPKLDQLTQSLPVLVIRDWSEILDIDFLESSWAEIVSKLWNPNLLSSKFWINLIKTT